MNKDAFRDDFPLLKKHPLIYLDTAASSLTPKRVIDKMNEYYYEYPVNVHRGVYALSHRATEQYTAARENIARFLNASFEETIFTRGASNALNLIATGYGAKHVEAGDEIVVSELEHHSHILPWQQLAKKKQAKLVYVPLDKTGRITVENFKKVLTDRTKIVALTYVSNVMGYETPLEAIIPLAHEKGAIVSVDAAQAAPHRPIDVQTLDCDFLAFSSHKMFGPTGIGVLYGKQHLLDAMDPIEYGGDMNDAVDKFDAEWKASPYKFETGTPPIAEAIGFSEAINYIEAIGFETIINHEKMLRQKAIEGLKAIEGITIYNPTADTGIINFNIDGVHPHDAVSFFDQDHIALRAGHHCAQLVVKWLKVPATLRASFYIYNNESDCEAFISSVTRARKFFSDIGF